MNLKSLLIGMVVCLGFSVLAEPVQAGGKNLLAGSEWGAGKKQFIQFSANGRVSGHGGCNRFFGSYKQGKRKLSFGLMASTKMGCRPAIMKSETRFHRRLNRVRKFSASHLKLKLFSASGRLIMVLRRRDWD